MASKSPVKTSVTGFPSSSPAVRGGSTAGPGFDGGAGGGGGGIRCSGSGKNVGQLISRRMRACAPSIDVRARCAGGGGPGGGGGGAGFAAATFSSAGFTSAPLPSPSPSESGPVGDALFASFDDSSEDPSDRAACVDSIGSIRRSSASRRDSKWNGHPEGMADATTSSSSRAAAASTGHLPPLPPCAMPSE